MDCSEYARSQSFTYSQRTKNEWEYYHDILYRQYPYRLYDNVGFLFIIGGDDIIPTPIISNFIPGTDIYVPTDIIYGYYDPIFRFVNINTVFNRPVRFHVGRLPLGTDATFAQFQSYLERSSLAMQNGIPVQMAYAQCDPNWKQVSENVMEELSRKGLIPNVKAHPQLIYHDIFLSPFVTSRNIDEAFNTYANLYFFNLHGSGSPDIPYFIGFPDAQREQRIPYPAITPKSFEESQFDNIIVTEACYGGKHKDLATESSMLLNSITNSTLLFLGSSITAYGAIDKIYRQSSQIYGADVIAKEFISALMDGETAGEALHIARKKLFDKPVNEYKFVNMLTVLEFSLYGDPALHAVFPGTKDNVKESVPLVFDENNISDTMQVETIYNEMDGSILAEVRDRVNRDLQDLNNHLQSTLAEYGIHPRKLASVFKVRYGNESHKMLYYKTESGENPVVILNEANGKKVVIMPKQNSEPLHISVNYRELFREACQRFGLIPFDDEDVSDVVVNSPCMQNKTAIIDKRIENKSKKQVKTFNAVLDTVYRPVMDNGDITALSCKSCDYDFSLLINPLSILLETELKQSIIKYFSINGITLPKDLTFGSILYCIEENKTMLIEYGFSDGFISSLQKLRPKRNKASHDGGVIEQEFLAFYDNFIKAVTSKSFTRMMDLKMNYKTNNMEKYNLDSNRSNGRMNKKSYTTNQNQYESGAKNTAEALSDDISVIKNKIVWNVPMGEIAYRISEKEMDSLLNVTGIVVDEGVTAHIYINGKLASEIHGGNYDFVNKEELSRKLNARFGGFADKMKDLWKVIMRFWVGTSLNERIQQNIGGIERMTNIEELVSSIRQDDVCSIVLKVDKEFPLVFEQEIQTSCYNGTVGLSISAQITDFRRFFQYFLMGGQNRNVTNIQIRELLKNEVANVLRYENFVKGIVTEENKEHIKLCLQDRVAQTNTGISIIRVNDCCINSEDLNRLRALDREIYLSEEEIDRLHRINVIKNRLNDFEVQQQIEEARGQLDIARALNEINRDRIATDEEMNAFVETIAYTRKLRTIQNQEDFDEAVAKIRKAKILREEDINMLIYEISVQQYKRGTEFSLMQLRDSIERNKIVQNASQESEVSAVTHKVGLERIKDAYKDERFQIELEQRKKIHEQSFKEQKDNITLAGYQLAIEDRKHEAEHKRQMETLQILTGHEENVLRIKSEMTAEQLTAEQLSKLTPEAQKAYFDSIATQAQIKAEKEKADYIKYVSEQNADRIERIAYHAMDTVGSSVDRERKRADEYKENLYRTQDRNDRQQEQILRYTMGNPQSSRNASTGPVNSAPQPPVVQPPFTPNGSSQIVVCRHCGERNNLSNGNFCANCKRELI